MGAPAVVRSRREGRSDVGYPRGPASSLRSTCLRGGSGGGPRDSGSRASADPWVAGQVAANEKALNGGDERQKGESDLQAAR